VGRCNASISRTFDLVTLRIDDPSSSFVSGLKADFAFQSFDLLVIEEIAVLVSVFNLFFVGEYAVTCGNSRC
jgi:hypothetical protein